MGSFVYVMPLLIVVGFGLYYFNLYKKGKAAGGGLVSGIQANHLAKWQDMLQPGEQFRVNGSGVLWRPWWQYALAKQVPLLRLVWPVTLYDIILTDRDRVLVANYSVVGMLTNKASYPRSAVRVEGVSEEKQGLGISLNPFVPKDYKTYGATVVLSDRSLKMCCVSGPLVDSLRAP